MKIGSIRPGTMALVAITLLIIVFEAASTIDNVTGADHTADIATVQHILLGLFVAAVTGKTLSLEVRKKENGDTHGSDINTNT